MTHSAPSALAGMFVLVERNKLARKFGVTGKPCLQGIRRCNEPCSTLHTLARRMIEQGYALSPLIFGDKFAPMLERSARNSLTSVPLQPQHRRHQHQTAQKAPSLSGTGSWRLGPINGDTEKPKFLTKLEIHQLMSQGLGRYRRAMALTVDELTHLARLGRNTVYRALDYTLGTTPRKRTLLSLLRLPNMKEHIELRKAIIALGRYPHIAGRVWLDKHDRLMCTKKSKSHNSFHMARIDADNQDNVTGGSSRQ